MKDFTKIKLINSLIDVVDRFYELKNDGKSEASSHLKGFCEGMAYSLMELGYLDKAQTKKIMSGLGKKLSQSDIEEESEPKEIEQPQDLSQEPIKEDEENQMIVDDKEQPSYMHHTQIFTPQIELNDLDLPTYIRKKRDS
jgi:hypothetical protein